MKMGWEGRPHSTDPSTCEKFFKLPISALKSALSGWVQSNHEQPGKAVNFPWLGQRDVAETEVKRYLALPGRAYLSIKRLLSRSPRGLQILFIYNKEHLFPGMSFFQASFPGFKRHY